MKKPGVPYSTIRDQVSTLDVILFHGSDVFSELISNVERVMDGEEAHSVADFTHVGLCLKGSVISGTEYRPEWLKDDVMYIFESTASGKLADGVPDVTGMAKFGVQLRVLDDVVKRYDASPVTRLAWCRLRPEFRERCCDMDIRHEYFKYLGVSYPTSVVNLAAAAFPAVRPIRDTMWWVKRGLRCICCCGCCKKSHHRKQRHHRDIENAKNTDKTTITTTTTIDKQHADAGDNWPVGLNVASKYGTVVVASAVFPSLTVVPSRSTNPPPGSGEKRLPSCFSSPAIGGGDGEKVPLSPLSSLSSPISPKTTATTTTTSSTSTSPPSPQFCSELVANIYRNLGIFSPEIIPKNVMPMDLIPRPDDPLRTFDSDNNVPSVFCSPIVRFRFEK